MERKKKLPKTDKFDFFFDRAVFTHFFFSKKKKET